MLFVIYNAICDIVQKYYPEKFERNKDLNDINRDSNYLIKFNIYNFMIINIINKKIYNEDGCAYDQQTAEIIFIGPDRFKYRKIIKNKIENSIKDSIYIINNTNIDRRRIVLSEYENFDNFIMNETDKRNLINQLDKWISNKEYYISRGINHKLGILIYGEPGTGKSSLIKAIGNYIKCINIIYTNDFNYNIPESSIRPNIIVVEDIDLKLQSYNRDFMDLDSKKNMDNMFQSLDGYNSQNFVIYIATTNCVDNLDPALTRAGRFDIKINLSNFDKELSTKMANKFGYNESILKELDIKYPIQPALLQKKLIEYHNNN